MAAVISSTTPAVYALGEIPEHARHLLKTFPEYASVIHKQRMTCGADLRVRLSRASGAHGSQANMARTAVARMSRLA
jgi:hypothetical protein